MFTFSKKKNQDNLNNLPNHVAIIPDGNRRWAKNHNLPSSFGHLTGAKQVQSNMYFALNLGIYCVSGWGSSYDNLIKRSKSEIEALFKIFKEMFEELLNNPEIHKNKVRVMIIGRWREFILDNILDKSIIDAFDTIIDTTKMYDNHCFIYYIGYNGTDEMIHAIKEIVEDSKKNENLQITESVLENHLWSGSLPPVDLVIRTGVDNDPHNSAGFMMWKTANSQYYFTKIKHPDFTNDEFMKAIKDYQIRERRLGK